MIDFHCHILPGIDDGAKDWEESLKMALYLYKQGVDAVVATPHYLEGHYTPEPKEIMESTRELQRKLIIEGINLKVYPGCEIYFSLNLPDWVKQGKVLTINNGGRYLLVEFPFVDIPNCTYEVFAALKRLNITPVIAHPERNVVFANDEYCLNKLIEQGCLIQINAGSLTGFYGKKAEKRARILAHLRNAQFLGSDMHGVHSFDISLHETRTLLNHIVGSEEVLKLVHIRASQVLEENKIEPSGTLSGELGYRLCLNRYRGLSNI